MFRAARGQFVPRAGETRSPGGLKTRRRLPACPRQREWEGRRASSRSTPAAGFRGRGAAAGLARRHVPEHDRGLRCGFGGLRRGGDVRCRRGPAAHCRNLAERSAFHSPHQGRGGGVPGHHRKPRRRGLPAAPGPRPAAGHRDRFAGARCLRSRPARRKWSGRAPAARAAIIPLRELHVEAGSPLGLWLARQPRPLEFSFRVYPNLRDRATAALFLRTADTGLRVRRQVGKGREFEQPAPLPARRQFRRHPLEGHRQAAAFRR